MEVIFDPVCLPTVSQQEIQKQICNEIWWDIRPLAKWINDLFLVKIQNFLKCNLDKPPQGSRF